MTSQPGEQTIAIHILLNIARIKGNQAIKFGQLIGYNKRNINVENHTENEAWRLVLDLLFFKNTLYKVKAIGLQLGFTLFR